MAARGEPLAKGAKAGEERMVEMALMYLYLQPLMPSNCSATRGSSLKGDMAEGLDALELPVQLDEEDAEEAQTVGASQDRLVSPATIRTLLIWALAARGMTANAATLFL